MASLRWLGRVCLVISIFPFIISGYIGYYSIFSHADNIQRFFTTEKTGSVRTDIVYSRQVIATNNYQAVIHAIQLPLSAINIALTPPISIESVLKHRALTTTEALKAYHADIAINASFFSPFKDSHFLDFYPHTGDSVEPIGMTFSAGQWYGRNARWPILIIYKDGRLAIKRQFVDHLRSPEMISMIDYAVSGRSILIDNGLVVANSDKRSYPRVSIGFNRKQDTLWLFVVDGKQPFYSDGITLSALSEYMLSKGVYKAMELDGGGSATLVWSGLNGEVERLNRPIHTKIPHRERPVANHFLIRLK